MSWVVCHWLILHNAAIASVSTWKVNQGLWCVESGRVWLWFQATFPLSPFQFRCPWQWEVLATSQTGRYMLALFPDLTQLSSMLGESLRTRYISFFNTMVSLNWFFHGYYMCEVMYDSHKPNKQNLCRLLRVCQKLGDWSGFVSAIPYYQLLTNKRFGVKMAHGTPWLPREGAWVANTKLWSQDGTPWLPREMGCKHKTLEPRWHPLVAKGDWVANTKLWSRDGTP